jgi:F-type H+-transporting ATPase subunit epsilon
MALRVELVSPERVVYSGEADMVIARTVEGGDIAFMDGHTPFVGALEIATATITSGDREEQAAVHGGFVEVSSVPAAGGGAAESGLPASQTVVTILSDVAELADEIDINRARRAREAAEQHLREEHDAEVEGALRRSHVRLAAAE